ncbi:MAG: membrane fusion protein (multidrug efflux system) [Cellvibrionaceae bacterium]|jgi:membrane fusion protein (multidrug efflux system)
MKKTFFWVVVGLCLVISSLVYVKYEQISTLISSGKNFTPPATTTTSFDVQKTSWEQTLSSIGSLEATKGLIVTADISGRISNVLFEAGSEVKAGDLLIQQDTSEEQARLRSNQAAAALAKSTLERITKLYNQKVASKSELDNSKSTYDSAVANVDNTKAAIEKKSIRAPFAGRLGIRLVNLGQFINTGDSVVSLQAIDKMYVNFSLPQQFNSKVDVGLSIRLESDAVPEKQFLGSINAIDPEIEVATRSVRLQAVIDNPNKELLPGMFATIDVLLPNNKAVLYIPVTAVQYATFGDSVFVIEAAKDPEKNQVVDPEKLIVRQQFVKLGESRGDFVAVDKGLNETDKIASTGVFKLSNGGSVVINNSVVPNFSISPDVPDE